jgi:site-specific recombinase XerD
MPRIKISRRTITAVQPVSKPTIFYDTELGNGVARALTQTTRSTVGVAVSPHLFRTAIASSAAIHGGANPHLATALLHHTDARVTEVSYNRASTLSAAESLRKIVQG